MDKKEAQDLIKVLNNLVNVLKGHNQTLRDNTEAMKELRTRLGSVANAITSGGSVVNP